MPSSSDLFKIFEIEDEIGSALVMDDEDMSPYRYDMPHSSDRAVKPDDSSQRDSQASTTASPRSGREVRPAMTPLPLPEGGRARSRSRQRAKSPQRPHSPPRQRTRLPSMRGDGIQSFTSPLAQIYQPLAVDVDIPEDDALRPEGSGSPRGSPRERRISHATSAQVPVPQIRARRVSSNVRRVTPDIAAHSNSLAPTSALKHHFPSVSEDHGPGAISESPEPLSNKPVRVSADASPSPSHSTGPGVAAEGGGAPSAMRDSMSHLEKRQERMESMLAQLLEEVKSMKSKDV